MIIAFQLSLKTKAFIFKQRNKLQGTVPSISNYTNIATHRNTQPIIRNKGNPGMEFAPFIKRRNF